MKDALLLIPVALSFLISFYFMPTWIRKSKEMGLVWHDMNKYKEREVSGSGGIVVVLGFITGVLAFIAYRIFYLKATNSFLIELFALSLTILFLSGLGFIDDLMGWRKGGMTRKSRLILMVLSAVPLIVINAGKSQVVVPFLGIVDLGLIYPVFLVPLGIVGASAAFNMLAGFNGLEAGQGIIILSSLGIIAYLTGSPWISLVLFIMAAALLGFLVYNVYPAKIFPGDSLTYAVGSLIAISAILGNFERIAVFFFIPYIIEVGLKSRGKLKKQSFGKPNKDNVLDLRYEKIYGLTHLAIYIMKKMNIKPTEGKVVLMIWAFQLLVVLIGFALFRGGIFV